VCLVLPFIELTIYLPLFSFTIYLGDLNSKHAYYYQGYTPVPGTTAGYMPPNCQPPPMATSGHGPMVTAGHVPMVTAGHVPTVSSANRPPVR
jgi:hypothetical protein